MKALGTTIVMAIIAAVACGVAYYYYPTPMQTVIETEVDKLLFEPFESRQVRGIKIDQFDVEENASRKIQLSQIAGNWLIPDKDNYLASNTDHVTAVISSLTNCTILELVSDQQKDHEQYGVIEPGKRTSPSVTSVGTKVVLEDRNQNPLAELIIGLPTRDASKRFVCKPGQPQIYVVEIDADIFDTEFTKWVDGNLLRFASTRIPLDSVDLENYLVNTQDLSTPDAEYSKEYNYRALFKNQNNEFLVDFWEPDENQALPDLPTIGGAEANLDTLRATVRQLSEFAILDVKKKTTDAARHLAEPSSEDSAQHFQSLVQSGFRRVGMENGQHQFDSVSGEIKLAFQDGVVYRIYFGNLAGLDIADRSKISRYMMITAEVDESILPMPKMPETEQGDSEANGETAEPETDAEAKKSGADASPQETQQDDDPQREYQRQLKAREQIIQAAYLRASAMNQLHADWLYVISENAIRNLFPAEDKFTGSADAHDHDH